MGQYSSPYPAVQTLHDRRTAGFQRWAGLTFVHWRLPAAQVQARLPKSLRVLEFDGSAWLGLVPFAMEKIRPWWSPPIPGVSWFLETNLRTYVVDEQGREGVWFFSLEADSWLAVTVARYLWHLPYWYSELHRDVSMGRDPSKTIRYNGFRRSDREVAYEISVELPQPDQAEVATPGTLEFFLVERYRLFALDRRERLRMGIVHHEPYRLSPVVAGTISESLTRSAGFSDLQAQSPAHWAFSWGVDVRVSPLTMVNRPRR
ncbi:MAG: DUF2071 domain-containing protein [Planctomycetaceae bacterium]|nr:DUF2071 domain-containing protein [Planctomycetaceae bacterium]